MDKKCMPRNNLFSHRPILVAQKRSQLVAEQANSFTIQVAYGAGVSLRFL